MDMKWKMEYIYEKTTPYVTSIKASNAIKVRSDQLLFPNT